MPAEYHFLLSPELGLRSDEVMEAWREDEECAAGGTAQVTVGQREGFDFDVASAAAGALIVLGGTLSKDLIVELVKRALNRAEARKANKEAGEIVVEQVPDAKTGLPLFVVRRGK